MAIRRQHFETEINELYGKTCDEIIAVAKNDNPEVVILMYIQVDKIWHRLYLDAGALFWHEGMKPDEEEDIFDDENYLNLGIQQGFKGKEFSLIQWKDDKFTICFENNRGLQMIEKGDETIIKML